VPPEIDIANKAIPITKLFVLDIFKGIATEGARFIGTLGDREIQTAYHLVRPGDLAKDAVSEDYKAFARVKSD
jgi:hypothetical protein